MKLDPKHFDQERIAVIEEQAKSLPYSIVDIGGIESIGAWRRANKLIRASQQIISDIKAKQAKARAVKIVEEMLSEVKFDDKETAYKDARKPTKFDKLVQSLSGSRKRNFSNESD